MKLSSVLVVSIAAYRVSASGGIGFLACVAGCSPLFVLAGPAGAACVAGCTALANENQGQGTARFQPDGTIVFDKETPSSTDSTPTSPCAEACKPLVDNQPAYAACLAGCGGYVKA